MPHVAAGLLRQRSGDHAGAAARYEAALAADPYNVDALHLLGVVRFLTGDAAAAVGLLREAAGRRPDDAEIRSNLGAALHDSGDPDGAADAFRAAIALDAASLDGHANLAAVLVRLGRADEAIGHFAAAWRLSPKTPRFARRAGELCLSLGRHAEAATWLARYLALQPADAAMHAAHGQALDACGDHAAAIEAYRRAIAADPACEGVRIALARCLLRASRLDEAAALLESVPPGSADYLRARHDLCVLYAGMERHEDACRAGRQLPDIPGFGPQMFIRPHAVLRDECDFDGIDRLAIAPDAIADANLNASAANFLELVPWADTDERIGALLRLHRRWGDAVMAEAARAPLPPLRPARSDGPLRIGLVSSDLRRHSVGRFVMPLVEHYDRSRLEIVCYAPQADDGDDIQRRIRARVADFRVVGGLPDRALAQAVRDDRIDILFELNGFTAESRLRALAYRAAPVQVYWIGYPFSTGLPAMDYFMLDADFAPERTDWLVEKPLVMPESWLCYDSFEEVPVAPEPPSWRNGFVTFGTLNNPYKTTREAVALWARAMAALPESRFLMVHGKCASPALRANLTDAFGRCGIAAGRLAFVDNRAAGRSHFDYYNEIDLSLDSFPQTGGTTTADALWMGVPVVTLVGPAMHQRISYAVLRKLGLDELCARAPDDFVARAVELAGDPARLRAFRATLRQRMKASPLCGPPGDFARRFAALMADLARRHGLR